MCLQSGGSPIHSGSSMNNAQSICTHRTPCGNLPQLFVEGRRSDTERIGMKLKRGVSEADASLKASSSILDT
jgi:hypothetical protein